MNQEHFEKGARVSVSPEYHWAKGAKGTVGIPPEVVRRIAGNWQGVRREVDAVRGPITFYWIYFDTPQPDLDDDGPFVGAEIDMAYLCTDSDIDSLAVPTQQENLQAIWYENEKLGKKVEFKAFVENEATSPGS
jgi:hypothetical protein